MSENHSGSRWEPAPADDLRPNHERATGLLDGPSPSDDGGTVPVATPTRPAPRRRALAAAAAAALLLVGGAGGYAIGHATAGTAAPGARDLRTGGPGDFRGGSRGAGDGGGTAGTGTTGSTGPST